MTDTLWKKYREQLWFEPALGVSLDLSRMDLPEDWFARHQTAASNAFAAMIALESGAIANPDEQRMVGHYWLRDSAKAPNAEIRTQIDLARETILQFVADVHAGIVRPETSDHFRNVLVIGIGGSALGPQFVSSALTTGPVYDRAQMYFFDNTDPDGMDRCIASMGGPEALRETLCVVISKSGGTKETRNGMLEAAQYYRTAGLSFAKHAVAVTGAGSELDRVAKSEGWIATFPMWDWVGGRTSELSAVGLLPAALQGIDVRAMLSGAAAMDAHTRLAEIKRNPAMQLALAWWFATDGRGAKDMVILPYKDRLELFSRYLQQLVMESLGKEFDVNGTAVYQGIAVYGNKGSTDQHAYVQQLRDGVHNFFVTFIQVLRDRAGHSIEVEKGITSGDYLLGFLEGTRKALHDKGRGSITICLERVDAFNVGMLIALYERAVGFYGALAKINAYHQPGVEAGKKAAAAVITLQNKVMEVLRTAGKPLTVSEIASLAASSDEETVFKLLQHLSANAERKVRREIPGNQDLFSATYYLATQ